MIKIAINGFGRIGRMALRAWLERDDLRSKSEVVVINTSGSMPVLNWAHLLLYDTAYGKLDFEVEVEEIKKPNEITDKDPLIGYLIVRNKKIAILAQPDPNKLPWSKYEIDVVIESTGKFVTEKLASAHLDSGAKKILISAPGKGGSIGTYVLGANEYKGEHKIANNASCTTNCVAPVAGIVHEKLGIRKAMLTTVHGYTDDQRLQDNSHKNLRRARAAAQNIIPTSTGAAIATTETIPEIKGFFDGVALRVPVLVGSISDMTFLVKKKTTVAEVNNIFKEATDNRLWKDIVGVTEEELVSSDIVGRKESAIVDLKMTRVVDGDLVKLMAWYDNEWGYANRLVEQAIVVGNVN